MAKHINKTYLKELREKSAAYYDSIPALNWGPPLMENTLLMIDTIWNEKL
jgi:hypothetical protein